MSGHDQRMTRAIVAVCALGLAWMALQVALDPSLAVMALPWVCLLSASAVLAWRGHSWSAPALLFGAGIPLLLAITLLIGGVHGRPVAYFPLAVLVTWSWFGRAWAGVVLACCLATLGVAWATGLQPHEDLSHRGISFSASYGVLAAFLGSIVHDLRETSNAAWRELQAAEQAAREAREAHEARDRFLSAVSHELRTPLDAVLGYAELVIELETDADRHDDARRIRDAGEQLLGLVNDLIDAGSGRIPATELAPIDISELIREVVSTIAPMVADAGNHVRVAEDPRLPALISDRRRVRQILLNLVSNASKYTDHGRVEIRAYPEGEGVVFEVEDSGVGIPPDKVKRLFQPFVQVHTGGQQRPGIGLGLALSQRLAERLGGQITARSVVGVGSTFTLRLPARPARARAA